MRRPVVFLVVGSTLSVSPTQPRLFECVRPARRLVLSRRYLQAKYPVTAPCWSTIGQRAAGGGGWPLEAVAAWFQIQWLAAFFAGSQWLAQFFASFLRGPAIRIGQAPANGGGQKFSQCGLRATGLLRLATFPPRNPRPSLVDSQPRGLVAINIDSHTWWIASQRTHCQDSSLVSSISLNRYLLAKPHTHSERAARKRCSSLDLGWVEWSAN